MSNAVYPASRLLSCSGRTHHWINCADIERCVWPTDQGKHFSTTTNTLSVGTHVIVMNVVCVSTCVYPTTRVSSVVGGTNNSIMCVDVEWLLWSHTAGNLSVCVEPGFLKTKENALIKDGLGETVLGYLMLIGFTHVLCVCCHVLCGCDCVPSCGCCLSYCVSLHHWGHVPVRVLRVAALLLWCVFVLFTMFRRVR